MAGEPKGTLPVFQIPTNSYTDKTDANQWSKTFWNCSESGSAKINQTQYLQGHLHHPIWIYSLFYWRVYYILWWLLRWFQLCPHPTKYWIHTSGSKTFPKLMKSIWLLSNTYLRSSRPYGENFDRQCVALFIHMYDGHGNPIDESESGAMRKAIDKRLMYPCLSCIVCVFPQGQNRTDFLTSPVKCYSISRGLPNKISATCSAGDLPEKSLNYFSPPQIFGYPRPKEK